jgi:hypothetical protein
LCAAEGVSEPACCSRRAQGTLTGWSGDVVPAAERKRLVARLDVLAAHISAMKK